MSVPLLTFSRTSSRQAYIRALFIGSEREPRISSFPSVAAILRLVEEGFGVPSRLAPKRRRRLIPRP